MSLTKITWEEFDTFDKIESPKGYDFRTHRGKYYTFEINPSDFNEYLLGKRTAREIDFKAQNDCWPPTEEEKKASEKRFIEESPTSLIDLPETRDLFTKEELEKLIPIAEQMWIDWRGKLPKGYVSPLEKGE